MNEDSRERSTYKLGWEDREAFSELIDGCPQHDIAVRREEDWRHDQPVHESRALGPNQWK